MSKLTSVINQLDLKLLNISELKFEIENMNEIEKWSCNTTIDNIDCMVELFTRYEQIQLYITPNIVFHTNANPLEKVNQTNLHNICGGFGCYIETDSEAQTIILKSINLDSNIYSIKTIVEILNASLLVVSHILKELNT